MSAATRAGSNLRTINRAVMLGIRACAASFTARPMALKLSSAFLATAHLTSLPLPTHSAYPRNLRPKALAIAPQRDGIVDPEVVSQIPVTQAVVGSVEGGHRRCVVAAYWRVLNVQGLINPIPQPS